MPSASSGWCSVLLATVDISFNNTNFLAMQAWYVAIFSAVENITLRKLLCNSFGRSIR